MPPGESAPEKTAPAPLRLVQRFVNSVDLENGQDELTSPDALREWLAARDLMDSGEKVTAADLGLPGNPKTSAPEGATPK
jgi:hypothetical protein